MNTEQVLQRLEPIRNTQVREVEHNPRTRVLVEPQRVAFRPGSGGHLMEMTPGGVMSMTKLIGLNEAVVQKLRPNTFGDVATQLLGHRRKYSLVVKDGAITSVVRNGEFHTVNPERLMRTIDQAIPQAEFHRVLILDDLVASLEVIGERRQPVISGDLIQAGANITFSPIGTINPMVQSYALRLICTNGMTDNTILREFAYGGGGGGEGDDVWQWFRRSVRDAYGSLDRLVARYREMVNEQIAPEHRAHILAAMLREAKITGNEAEAVRALAIENPPENRYEMLNLITQAASHMIERPQAVRRAQLTAAEYTQADVDHTECPLCHNRN